MRTKIESVQKFLKSKTVLMRIMTVSAFDLMSKGASVFLFILLIRILAKADFAKLTFFNSVSFFVFGAVGVGISASYVRYESERVSRAETGKSNLYLLYIILIYVIYFIILLAGVLFILLANNSILSKLGNVKLSIYSILYSLPLCIQSMNENYFQARGRFKKAGTIYFLKNTTVLACILICTIFFELDLDFVLITFIATSLSIAFYYMAVILKENKLTGIDLSDIKETLRSSSWLIVYCIFLSLFTQMDVFMISARLDAEMVANYGAASKYYSLLLTLLPSVMTVLKVRTSQADMLDDMSKQREYIITWIKKVAPPVTLLVGIICSSAYFFFPVLNGSKYLISIPAFQILCMGVIISYIFAPSVNMVIAMRKEKILCMFGMVACATSITGNYLLLPVYGINTAALITVLANAIINIASTLLVLCSVRTEKQVLAQDGSIM